MNVQIFQTPDVPVNQVFSVAENSREGTVVGQIQTTGVNPDSRLSFAIVGGNGLRQIGGGRAFSIDDSGTLRVLDARAINFETVQNDRFSVIV